MKYNTSSYHPSTLIDKARRPFSFPLYRFLALLVSLNTYTWRVGIANFFLFITTNYWVLIYYTQRTFTRKIDSRPKIVSRWLEKRWNGRPRSLIIYFLLLLLLLLHFSVLTVHLIKNIAALNLSDCTGQWNVRVLYWREGEKNVLQLRTKAHLINWQGRIIRLARVRDWFRSVSCFSTFSIFKDTKGREVKIAFFFIAYVLELAANTDKKICSINPRNKECFGLSSERIALFLAYNKFIDFYILSVIQKVRIL